MGYPPDYTSSQQDSDAGRQLLDWDGKQFTLNGVRLEVRIRPRGIRIGCHFATQKAIEQLAKLNELRDFT